ncbi:MAG TPA: hypothetical protein VLS44_06165 [Nitrospira sp.]|nr:hypothetical protein [Nitrospira sp.]
MRCRPLSHVFLALLMGCLLLQPSAVGAVPMLNDPKGFHNIPWGSALMTRTELEPARTGPHIKEYRAKTGPPSFADTEMTSILYVSVDDQFARVTIRYDGERTHKRVMEHLEAQYGPLERIPGQMTRGLNQQYTWRGTETEINLTYQASTERGFIFIDSRTLAPRFNDHITDSAE